jgi:hypothetical protein
LADEIANSSMFKSRDFTKKRLKIPKGQSISVYPNKQHNGKKKNVLKEKQPSTKHTYKAKVRVTRIPLKTGVNSGAPEGPADPAPLVVPVVLM